jgi:hypothetical protein
MAALSETKDAEKAAKATDEAITAANVPPDRKELEQVIEKVAGTVAEKVVDSRINSNSKSRSQKRPSNTNRNQQPPAKKPKVNFDPTVKATAGRKNPRLMPENRAKK